MRLQFSVQQHQADAVAAVVEVFDGQPHISGTANAPIVVDAARLLANTRAVQRVNGLPESAQLADSPAAPGVPNLDVEMETGTGKTYVYIKTIMELYRRHGWSKFIIVVPSVAIREGVAKTFEITAEHFLAEYGTRARAFVYDSAQLHELDGFATDPGIQVMIINIQAFNATGRDQRRIYDELDDFGSRRPIDVIRECRPIVIIDEPQKIGADKSLRALAGFGALTMLRYSATHAVDHTLVYRLDAVDAYRRRLVKKIAVRGITVRGLTGSSAYLYLAGIDVEAGRTPTARIELEVRSADGGIRRRMRRAIGGSRLAELSNGLAAYRDLLVSDVDAARGIIELSNGELIEVGRLADDDATEAARRRIQIREVVRAHLATERRLHSRQIKVLSLLFIDEVRRYRDYERDDTRGAYARCFETEYAAAVAELLADPTLESEYADYLRRDDPAAVHRGYFSVDRKSGRLIDNAAAIRRSGPERGQSVDRDAYDLILRDKERLLSPAEPVRFLFSHSALREGWDNPNVFVIGMLKRSDNTVSRRQEVGRGLRLAVDRYGVRLDDPHTIQDVNVLTVVTDESYTDFVTGLQREIGAELVDRPEAADRLAPVDDRRRNADPDPAASPRREFQRRWRRAVQPAAWRVAFDSAELVRRAVATLDRDLAIPQLEFVVETGEQRGDTGTAAGFVDPVVETAGRRSAGAPAYDLVGEIADRTGLTRRTVAAVLTGITPATFEQYRRSPERFIAEAARLISEQKAAPIIAALAPDPAGGWAVAAMFTAAQLGWEIPMSQRQPGLPPGITLPTPVGDHPVDVLYVVDAEGVRRIYVVARTRGTLSSLAITDVAEAELDRARRFFGERPGPSGDAVQLRQAADTDYGRLLELFDEPAGAVREN